MTAVDLPWPVPAPEPLSAQGIFGSNSDGGARMMEFLDVMCRGCVRESAKHRAAGEGGGWGCSIVDRVFDPDGIIPEWRRDVPWPEHITGPDGLDPADPWPVCVCWTPRKPRADKGLRRGPKVAADQGTLFE